MDLKNTVKQAFIDKFGNKPKHIVRAPGRVNIIGEHTDYNEGFVLPMAINRAVWIALQPTRDETVSAYSLNFDNSFTFSLQDFQNTNANWEEYLKGVAWALQQQGIELHGWKGVITGDVPSGAGLSSSAALELATARAFASVSGFDWNPTLMAKACQTAENQWVGVNCGIMDQLISATGIKDQAVLIDCRSLNLQPVPLPENTKIIVLDTATRRGLVDSAYNERRQQCEVAAQFFGVNFLRDVSIEQFTKNESQLDPITRKRARHVITENDRTLKAAQAMQTNDAVTLGKLMDQSHTSLRDDFEVSNDALNTIVSIARKQPGCFGARMTGAGFGGCAVALVDSTKAQNFPELVAKEYFNMTSLIPKIYVCEATNGAEIISSTN